MSRGRSKWTIAAWALVAAVITAAVYVLYPPDYRPLSFPDGRTFALSIVDDSDLATLENIAPVYELLDRLGIYTTKTVWVLPSNEPEEWPSQGDTLRRPEYRAFLLDLHKQGFEIASHGARGGSTTRAEILSAMEEFKSTFGHYPRLHVNHFQNLDNLYWGKDRLLFAPFRWAYDAMSDSGDSYGHVADSEYFWGDFVSRHVQYVPNFTFNEINTLQINPSMPYHEPAQPYVNYWYHTSEGGNLEAFNRLLDKANLDRLERQGGVSVVYTHFGKGFFEDGELDATFKKRLEDLASRNGWYVPASRLLDYIRQNRETGADRLSVREKLRLELLWLWEKLRYGPS